MKSPDGGGAISTSFSWQSSDPSIEFAAGRNIRIFETANHKSD